MGAVGASLQTAAVLWQVYLVSGSALQLGILGLMRFVPSFLLSLVAGALSDSRDRRKVIIASQAAPFVSSGVLLIATASGVVSVPLIYAMVFLVSIGTAFENPARQAIIPQLVRRETYHNAVSVHSALQQLAMAVGPAIAGLAIGVSGIGSAYAVHIAFAIAALTAYLLIRPTAAGGAKRPAVTVAAIKEGIEFVRHHQVLLGAMTLDMFAVIFGGAQSLLPIYAKQILHVGAGGYGLLTASQSIGALVMSVTLVSLPPIRRSGFAMLLTVTAFALTTIAFGISRIFVLSLIFYGLTGAADQMSVIMRQTTIQLATPDALRGRVSAINSLFIGTSNPIGAVESGLVAALAGAVFSVVSGGIGCLAVVGLVAVFMPQMRRYRISLEPTRVAPPAAQIPIAVAGQLEEGT